MTRDDDIRDDAGDWIATSSVGEPGSGRLDAFLNDLRSLAAGPPPAPSAELEAILDGGSPPVLSAPRARRHRKAIAGAVIMGSIGAGLSGTAAAAERPPGPARHGHAHVVPESAPAQDDPVGGRAAARARLPESLLPRIDPARPVPHATPPMPTAAQPTRSRNPTRSGEDRERDWDDAHRGRHSEHHGTPEPDHRTEHGEPPPAQSD